MKPFRFLSLALLCHLAPLHGQTGDPVPETASPEPIELRQIREQVQLQLINQASTLTDQYIKALATVEQESAAAGDYQQALNAQQRRQSLADLQALGSQSNSIVLKPAQATGFVGTVGYEANSDTLGLWRNAGSSASWEIARITPGSYDVIVTYGVAQEGEPPARLSLNFDSRTGGDFEFFEDSKLVGALQNRRSATVVPTAAPDDPKNWTTYTTQQLAPLQLTRSSARFTLRISRAIGNGGVMQLKEVRLTPASGNKSLTQDTPSDPVRTLQVAHQQRLKAIATPIIASYLQNLQARLAEATQNQQNEAATELQAEIERTQKWLDRPLAPSRARAAISLFEDVDEEWTDVRYVDDPSNSGDRFIIQHQGQHIPVRLKTVTCPPSTDEAAGELQHYAGYFGISPEEALAMGRQAKEFSSATLQNKPLRLLTNGQKDRDGRLRVTLFLPHLGDFSGILVDNGLAAITPLPKSRAAAMLTIDSCYFALRERESTARARSTPPGAWAYSEPPPKP